MVFISRVSFSDKLEKYTHPAVNCFSPMETITIIDPVTTLVETVSPVVKKKCYAWEKKGKSIFSDFTLI